MWITYNLIALLILEIYFFTHFHMFQYLQLQSTVQCFLLYEKWNVSEQKDITFYKSWQKKPKGVRKVTLPAMLFDLPSNSNAAEVYYPYTVASQKPGGEEHYHSKPHRFKQVQYLWHSIVESIRSVLSTDLPQRWIRGEVQQRDRQSHHTWLL